MLRLTELHGVRQIGEDENRFGQKNESLEVPASAAVPTVVAAAAAAAAAAAFVVAAAGRAVKVITLFYWFVLLFCFV